MGDSRKLAVLAVAIALMSNLVPDIPTAVKMVRDDDTLSEVTIVCYTILAIIVFCAVMEL